MSSPFTPKRKIEMEYLTWKEFDHFVQYIVEVWLPKPTELIGIAKGGLPIAVALANHWEIPLNTFRPEFLGTDWILNTKGMVLVDDIVDSGRTVRIARECLREDLPVISWITKINIPQHRYYRRVDPDVWVVFPWEDRNKAKEAKERYERQRTEETI